MNKQKLSDIARTHRDESDIAQQELSQKRVRLHEEATAIRELYTGADEVALAVFSVVSAVGDSKVTSRGTGHRQADNQRSGATVETTNPETGKVKRTTQPPVNHRPRWRAPFVRDLKGNDTGVSQTPTTRTTTEYLTHTGNMLGLGVLDEDSDQPVRAYASFFYENGVVPSLDPKTSLARVNVGSAISHQEGPITQTGSKIGVRLFVEEEPGTLTEIQTFESTLPSPIERSALAASGANSDEQSRIDWAVIHQFPDEQLADQEYNLREISSILEMAYAEHPTLDPSHQTTPPSPPPAPVI